MDRAAREDGPQTSTPRGPMPSLAALTRAMTPSFTNLCDAAGLQAAAVASRLRETFAGSPEQGQTQKKVGEEPQPQKFQQPEEIQLRSLQQHLQQREEESNSLQLQAFQKPSKSVATCIDVDPQLANGCAPSSTTSLGSSLGSSVCSQYDMHVGEETTPGQSACSVGSVVCRICHNNENPETLVAPCLCKGSLTYVHIGCLERWITTSRSTMCELCQFHYDTQQTLRYTLCESLRMWYSRAMSRRALQEDCQMFSLLTLVAFGIIGTLLVGIQYYIVQEQSWGLARLWTRGWLVFFLLTTLSVYLINVYMILRSQLVPWYRWWQSAREIKLILENRKPLLVHLRQRHPATQPQPMVVTPPPTPVLRRHSAAAESLLNFPQVVEELRRVSETQAAAAAGAAAEATPSQPTPAGSSPDLTIPLTGSMAVNIAMPPFDNELLLDL